SRSVWSKRRNRSRIGQRRTGDADRAFQQPTGLSCTDASGWCRRKNHDAQRAVCKSQIERRNHTSASSGAKVSLNFRRGRGEDRRVLNVGFRRFGPVIPDNAAFPLCSVTTASGAKDTQRAVSTDSTDPCLIRTLSAVLVSFCGASSLNLGKLTHSGSN